MNDRFVSWGGVTLISALVAACTGVIGGSDNNPDGVSTVTAKLCAGDPKPGPAPLRRLTRAQYNNTVRDLLGDTTRPANDFPPDEAVGDFSNVAVSQTVSPLLAQGYESAAEALAAKAVTNMGALLPCNPQQAGEDACAKSFIAAFGKRAFRRPLTQAESDAMFALYTTNRAGADFTNGVQAVIEAMLQSGQFLYMPEVGQQNARAGNAVPLTSWEIASRLSYLVWNTMPDDALFAAAEKNELQTTAQIEAAVRRMFADPKARDATSAFFAEWMRTGDLEALSKDPTTYPDYSADVGKSMAQGFAQFTSSVVWDGDGRIATLLTSPTLFLDAKTAPLFGAKVSGAGLQKVDMDASRYAGLLTQPAVLTVFAKPNQSSPVLRGKFVRERLLCQTLPPPPANLVIKPPEVKPGQTTRQRFAEHDKNPECAGCHHLMDPVGFGFESFDGMGRWRDQDQGLPVDASGTLASTDVDGDFVGAKALASKLATSTEVRECVGTEYFRYVMARGVDGDDDCSLGMIKDALTSSDGNVRELIVMLAKTPAFRFRRAP